MKKLLLLISLLLATNAWGKVKFDLSDAVFTADHGEKLEFIDDSNFSGRLSSSLNTNEYLDVKGYYETKLLTFSGGTSATGNIYKPFIQVYFRNTSCSWKMTKMGDYWWFEKLSSNLSGFCGDMLMKQILPKDKSKHLNQHILIKQ